MLLLSWVALKEMELRLTAGAHLVPLGRKEGDVKEKGKEERKEEDEWGIGGSSGMGTAKE